MPKRTAKGITETTRKATSSIGAFARCSLPRAARNCMWTRRRAWLRVVLLGNRCVAIYPKHGRGCKFFARETSRASGRPVAHESRSVGTRRRRDGACSTAPRDCDQPGVPAVGSRRTFHDRARKAIPCRLTSVHGVKNTEVLCPCRRVHDARHELTNNLGEIGSKCRISVLVIDNPQFGALSG